jgi:hypothetical protein
MKDMYDSTNAFDIPLDSKVVGGYVDGSWPWSAAMWARFPNAIKIRIVVSPWHNDGHVLDCESGDATPAQCPGWIRMRQASGLAIPAIYCNRSTRPQVEAACAGLNYVFWIATLDGIQVMQPGAVATQWQGQAQSGKHYDLSMVVDNWPGGGPLPTPAAPQPDQHVTPYAPIAGHTWGQPAHWYNWNDLSLRAETIPGTPAVAVVWTEAKWHNGIWYDRVEGPGGAPGSWALMDSDIDDGGFEPPHFVSAPAPTSTPAPAAPPAAGPSPTVAANHWWGPYVQGADQVVELSSICHAPVIAGVPGSWYRGNTAIDAPAAGQYAEWVLANRINGVWYVMDESGGPPSSGGPNGRLSPDKAYWIDDACTDSSASGGTNPPAVADSGKGTWYNLVAAPIPVVVPPVVAPPVVVPPVEPPVYVPPVVPPAYPPVIVPPVVVPPVVIPPVEPPVVVPPVVVPPVIVPPVEAPPVVVPPVPPVNKPVKKTLLASVFAAVVLAGSSVITYVNHYQLQIVEGLGAIAVLIALFLIYNKFLKGGKQMSAIVNAISNLVSNYTTTGLNGVKAGASTSEFLAVVVGLLVTVGNTKLGLNLDANTQALIVGFLVTYIASRTVVKVTAKPPVAPVVTMTSPSVPVVPKV